MSKPYRKNVGIVVFNSKGQVLVGERIQFPGIFQFPQGGLDDGEQPLDGARRELYEETGLEVTGSPAGEIESWLTYEFPENIPQHLKKYRGQEQKWFFFFWDGNPETLQLDLHEREFLTVKWEDFRQITNTIIDFKKDVYERLYREGRGIISKFMESR